MRKFSKLHSYMKYCPNCDSLSRVSLNDSDLHCESCQNHWTVDNVVDEYETAMEQE